MERQPATGSFQVGFHHGNIISYLSALYGNVERVILEMIQNSLDAGATNIMVLIRLGDKRQNLLQCSDDGGGASKEEMGERIRCIGSRQKGDDTIGHKGVGNLAPIAIGHRYSMITRPRASRGAGPFFKVSFDRELIDGQSEVAFKWEDMPSYSGPNTVITVRALEPSALRALGKQVNPAQFLAEQVSQAYSAVIKRVNASITIRVEKLKGDPSPFIFMVVPQEFPGNYGPVVIATKRGPVAFDMYSTVKRCNRPVVLVEHQGKMSFDLRNMGEIWAGCDDVFGTGFLQGTIRLDFCTLNADRLGFVFDGDLDTLIEAIDEYCSEYGRPFLQDMETAHREENWTAIAGELLSDLKYMFKGRPELWSDELAALVSAGHKGSGKGAEAGNHRTRPKQPRSPQPEPRKPVIGKVRKTKNETHPSVGGKDGSPRRRVAGEKGLTIEFAEGDDTRGFSWRVMIENGLVLMNITHKDWVTYEDRGKVALRTYMAFLITKVMTVASIPGEWRDVFDLHFDEMMKFFPVMIPNVGRKPNRIDEDSRKG